MIKFLKIVLIKEEIVLKPKQVEWSIKPGEVKDSVQVSWGVLNQ